jgi:hypothetical protein
MRNQEFPPIDPAQLISKLKTAFTESAENNKPLTEQITREEVAIIIGSWAIFHVAHQGSLAFFRTIGFLQDFPK